MVECTALEMRRAWKGTVGSNPTLSAIDFYRIGAINDPALRLSARRLLDGVACRLALAGA